MKSIHLQLGRYALVGLTATLTQYLILLILVEWAGSQPVPASTIGSIFGSVVSYMMNHRFTFKSVKKHRDALWQFYSIAIVGTSLNALFMFIGVHQFKWHYAFSQVLTTALVLCWNFNANRYWTFRY